MILGRMSLRAVLFFVLATSGCGRVLGVDGIRFEETTQTPCKIQSDCDGFAEADPHACVEGECVALLDEEPTDPEQQRLCARVLGRENLHTTVSPFVFGALSFPSEEGSWLNDLNYELALEHFTAQGGLDVGGATRLPVAVVCDVAREESSKIDAALEHLTGEIGIRAILAPLPAAELKRSFERVYRDKRRSVFMLSPSASAPLLTAVADDGLLWHVLPPPRDLALVYPPLIRRVEEYLRRQRRQRRDAAAVPLRLALMSSPLAEDVEIASYLETALVLNGVPRAELDRDSYRRYVIEPEQADQGRSLVDAIVDLFAFRPNIVVALDDDAEAFVAKTLTVVEGAWEQVHDGQERPFFVVSAYQPRSTTLANTLREFPRLAERIVGVAPVVARDTALYAAYLSELQARSPAPFQLAGAESFYDAAYFLLYSATAAPGGPKPSGAELAVGMKRLISGKPIAMGSTQIAEALRELRDPGGSIALHGTLGPPDFDVATGARRPQDQGSVWCVTHEEEGEVVFHYDALSFDASNRGLVGQLECIPDF